MKKLWMAFLACVSFACMALGVACSKEDTTKLAFNEGYLEEIVLGEPILLEEYIDPNLTDDYTAILTCDETGVERDLKELVQWTTDRPGTYTLTYTVKSGAYKGTVSTKINVVVSEATWTYSNPTDLAYRAGDTLSLNLLKRKLNIAVQSYYSYEFYVKEVSYDNGKKVEDLRDATSYTFPEHGDFTFTFGAKTEDGQVLEGDYTLTVRKQQVMAAGAQEWMDENNITVEQDGYTYISPDGYVELDQGYCSGSYLKDYVPYLAFNGEDGEGYGANTYVMTEFTGKNLPQVAFFCDEVTSSFTDKKNGILFYNAFMTTGGSLMVAPHSTSFVVFGPDKVGNASFDTFNRLSGRIPDCPAGWNNLDDDCQYRYIVGIENATTTSMTARMLLINLTTSERVWDYSLTMSGYQIPTGTTKLNLPEDYYKGSIVLYGNYGSDLTLDKVYMPVTNAGDIYELDQAAEFKDGYTKYYNKGATANVADYAELSDGDEFRVVDPDGEEVTIDEDGNFTYTKSGTYRLYFIPADVNIRQSSTTVKVMYDLDSPMAADQLEKDGALAELTSQQIAATNTVADYIKEGSQSIRFYTINASESLDIYLTKEFTDFVFLDRRVQGVSFEIYSPNAIEYKLLPLTDDQTHSAYIKQDYTGAIAAETWTKVTLSRDLIMANYNTYKSKAYSIALRLVGSFAARGEVYVDNIQLVVEDVNGTVATEAQTFMTENNITAHAYDSINADLSVSLKKGYYQGNPTAGASPWMSNDDVPYIAYNGSYGAGSYVVADFTGKNIPQLCFFAKEITSSLTDGKAGFYVHTGMVYPSGTEVALHDYRRVTFFGPNKIEYGHIDRDGRLGQFGYNNTEGSEAPFSIHQLVDGTHYRYVIGVKSAAANKVVFELLLINLDTNTKVAYKEHTSGGTWSADYVNGSNIVMYGRYNVAITLDKIYDVYENVSDIYAIDKVSELGITNS